MFIIDDLLPMPSLMCTIKDLITQIWKVILIMIIHPNESAIDSGYFSLIMASIKKK